MSEGAGGGSEGEGFRLEEGWNENERAGRGRREREGRRKGVREGEEERESEGA